MIGIIVCAGLVLLVAGWVLHINSGDRKTFEKELEEDLKDDPDDRP